MTQPLNTQAPEKLAPPQGGLDVHSVFYTIQGEGPYAGLPAVFVRLAGCNLQCPFCDTEYTAGRKFYTFEDLWQRVCELLPRKGDGSMPILIVFTGGEPLRQREDLNLFMHYVGSLTEATFQIETNGTLEPLQPGVLSTKHFCTLTIVCSPKAQKVHPKFSRSPSKYFWKYVVRDGVEFSRGENGLQVSILGTVHAPYVPDGLESLMLYQMIYIQPLDEGDHERNKANARLAARICMEHGYKLCLQLHKIVDLP